MRRLAVYCVLLLCLGTNHALALSDKPYLDAGDADFASLLPPPPTDGSALDRRDMEGVLELQKGVTPARREQIEADTEQTVYQVAGKVLGPSFTKDRFPLAGAFFDKIRDDSAVGVRDIKQKYKRLRPFQANKQVQTPENIARASQGPTYPSGHSTFGAEVALLASMMVPDKAGELHARGWEYGEQRIASGVAYPSDWETAHIGATLMVALMMQKPAFKSDFEAVKAELRRGLRTDPVTTERHNAAAEDLFDTLAGDAQGVSFVSLERAERLGLCPTSRLPFTLRILAECALRRPRDGAPVDLGFLGRRPRAGIVEFHPARVLLQDFTGVPLMADLASLRDAIAARGGDPQTVNPKIPVDLVLDHALIAEFGGRPDARVLNERVEIERNRERFEFLKWCASAYDNVRLLPPGTGIMHQINLEYLSSVVRTERRANRIVAIPDTVLGADSHTTMVSGLGVLAWGVGGIEAEAAMLGYPTLISRPRVIGLRFEGELPAGTLSTDLVLHICELLRQHDVTGAFVEAWGNGVAAMAVETRATIANMAPEYGAASVYFPIDELTLQYLRLTGRDEDHVRGRVRSPKPSFYGGRPMQQPIPRSMTRPSRLTSLKWSRRSRAPSGRSSAYRCPACALRSSGPSRRPVTEPRRRPYPASNRCATATW